MSKVQGREKEITLLNKVYDSGEAELLAIYGRRRIGKTYLIRQYFENRADIYFEFTGQKDATEEVQLFNFKEKLESVFYGGVPIPALDSWNEALKTLSKALMTALDENGRTKRAVIFLDELPWMATPRSGLLQALDYFWNTTFSKMPRVILVLCGSAASWMLENLIHAKGGLHNRITVQIRLLPFTISETREFLEARKIKLNMKSLLEVYMALGGVPYYLKKIEKGRSAGQNVARICFSQNGILRTEFEHLFKALFGSSDDYENIVRVLAKNKQGVSREQLIEALGASSGGGLNRRLIELEEAGFITRLTPYNKKAKHALYRIIDPYIYFYLRWIEKAPGGVFAGDGENYWLEKRETRSFEIWAAYAFENLCLTHSNLIQNALGLDKVSCEYGSWNYTPPRNSKNSQGAQIDLLFDRADDVITFCEIKFNASPYSLDKGFAKDLKTKMEVFERVTRTRKNLQWVLVTMNGFKANTWSEDLVESVLDAKDIFK